jgi:hypothetical protein
VKNENRMYACAAKMLRAKGVSPCSRSVSHVVRLARSFESRCIGRFQAMHLAAMYIGRGKLKN